MNRILTYIKNNKTETLFVLLITLLALVLRIISFTNYGEIWYDELFSWYFANQKSAFLTMSELTKQDIHMPFYFVLLHFWIKLFSDSVNSMRICSLLLSFPLLPLSFYLTKSLFNKMSAYFTIIFIAINTFCIYYSIEVRFYGLVFVFSLLSAYFFVKMIEKFDKRSIVSFIVSIIILLYTFSITPLLIISYFVVGLAYLYHERRKKIKAFWGVFLIIFLLSFPALCISVANAIAMKGTLTYYPIDNYAFNWYIIYDIFENFFTLENAQILAKSFVNFRNSFDYLDNPKYLFFVIIPCFIAFFGLLKAIISKKTRFCLFFLPSFLFILIVFLLASNSLIALQTRYLSIIFPVVIIAFSFGLSTFRNKIAPIIIFLLFIYLNLTSLFFVDRSVFNMHKIEMETLKPFSKEYKISNDDLLLIPMSGTKLMYHIGQGRLIPFSIDDAVVLKDKKSARFYFGDKFNELKRENVQDYLIDYVIKDIPLESYGENLYNSYLKNMKKNDRLFYIVTYTSLLASASESGITYDNYKNENLVKFIVAKNFRDGLLVLQKYLKLVHLYEAPEGYSVFIFEK